jgi:hypothetical protein
MAVGMAVPMAGWMLYRKMVRRNTAEMAAAMVLPAIPFVLAVWSGATDTAPCGAYCVTSVVVTYVLMRHRRSEYAM